MKIWYPYNFKKSFTTQQFGLRTTNLGSRLDLTCLGSGTGWGGETYFPTYNGVDPLNEIKCIKGKWSLPDDIGPVKCVSIFCPLPDVGKEIETKCTRRDRACIAAGNYENEEDCECHIAESICKPEFITSYNQTLHEVEPLRTRNQSHMRLWYCTAKLNRFCFKWENSNYRSNFALPGFPNFSIFFCCTPNYNLFISHSSCPLTSGGTWNVKIIESPLP